MDTVGNIGNVKFQNFDSPTTANTTNQSTFNPSTKRFTSQLRNDYYSQKSAVSNHKVPVWFLPMQRRFWNPIQGGMVQCKKLWFLYSTQRDWIHECIPLWISSKSLLKAIVKHVDIYSLTKIKVGAKSEGFRNEDTVPLRFKMNCLL